MGEANFGIDPAVIKQIALEVQELHDAGVEVAIVIGAGNFFRGSGLAAAGVDAPPVAHRLRRTEGPARPARTCREKWKL